MGASYQKYLKTKRKREEVGETPRDQAIRVVAELLTAHEAARRTAGYRSPLTDADYARIKLVAQIGHGPHGDAVAPLIRQTFPNWKPQQKAPDVVITD